MSQPPVPQREPEPRNPAGPRRTVRTGVLAAGAAAVAVVLLAGLVYVLAIRDPADRSATVATSSPSATPSGVQTDSEPSPSPATPTVTTSPSPSASPSATTAPTPSPSPGLTPTATATPTPEPTTLAALEGAAVVEDPEGDLVDSQGRPAPEPDPAADLRAVTLEGEGDTLTVTFETAGDIPTAADFLLWSVDLFDGEERVYSVTVQQSGNRFFAGVLDWSTSEQRTPPDDPVVEGQTVSLRVPAAFLTGLDGPFEWQALSQQDGSFEDYVPGIDERATFPG